MEDQLTLKEMEVLLDTVRDNESKRMEFQAALKGIDLKGKSKSPEDKRWEEMKLEAIARANQMTIEEARQAKERKDFDSIGIGVETIDYGE